MNSASPITAVLDLAPGPEDKSAQFDHASAAVAVVGLGYVGLPTSLALLAAGNEVVGVDVSEGRLDAIRHGEVHLLPTDHGRRAAHADDPRFTITSEHAATARARTVVICVPTPIDRHLVPDLRALAAACTSVVEHAVPGQLLILTSTTYVGATRDLLAQPLTERGFQVGSDVFVAFSPERIDPGRAEHPHGRTPRVVGGMGELSTSLAAAVLRRTAPAVHVLSSAEEAEMTKLWENTFRAVNLALANEFAEDCRALGLQPRPIIEAAATKPYGFVAHYPGPGVGGHCIPCDRHYLLWQLRAMRVASPLVETAMSAIAARPRQVVRRVRDILADRGTSTSGARILLVGVSYKSGVADLRESPALEILAELAAEGAKVHFTDPLIPTLTLGPLTLDGVAEPEAEPWDLVVVHTVHPGTELEWLADQPAVLDATYRLGPLKAKAVL
ncbi:nucleotide sugar dehydrogenase [Streptomyces sp. NBC_00847]|uniref:nucleotide sugar dehydrogenase n=1 Tax=unclassified Streptomyces TaxID=2593676 RepID=UPI00225E01C4|nr:nucleotide sugar dehydrogenase [Streptomyces sp. NBC_00847]MCX4885372.1 nucleotide sugar dehydrogenase [Streptomyces sp. NBC_00847]